MVRFNSSMTYALRTIKLYVMAKGSVVMANYVVVDASTHYNLFLDRPWIHKIRVISSTYYQIIKYTIEEEIMEL